MTSSLTPPTALKRVLLTCALALLGVVALGVPAAQAAEGDDTVTWAISPAGKA